MQNQKSLLSLPIDDLIKFLKSHNIKRFYFIYDQNSKNVFTSHHVLEEIASYLNNESRDFEQHEGLFFQLDPVYNVIHSAAVHRTNRGQAAGGVRFWDYDTMGEFIRDGMRLAKGMTHKNALAGLWWGGGKGVVARCKDVNKNDEEIRKTIYTNFGKFITSLNGCYVTAEDVGTNVTDMENVYSQTRFTTCIPPKLGGSGNPSIPTAKGVVSGIEAAIDYFLYGNIEGKTIAVQGLGNVALPLIELLFEKGAKKVIASDIFEDKVTAAKDKFNEFDFECSKVDRDDNSILFRECDVLSPCATGGILNSETIPNISADIVCGAANNQLLDPESNDELIHSCEILYVPDFLTNRMGIVNCANEQYGYVNNDPMILKHYDKEWENSIFNRAIQVFTESKEKQKPTGQVALELADKLSREDHPIFGHRGQQIIKSLVDSNWEQNR